MPGRHRVQRRYAGHHRRRAVQPHAAGGGGRRQDRNEVPAGSGELGAVRRRGLRPGREHPYEPRAGCGDRAGRRRFRHRHSRELAAGDRRREGEGREALSHSGWRFRSQARRARLCRLRGRGAGAGAGARHRRSTTSWSAPSPARPTPACSWASPRTGVPTRSSASTRRRLRPRPAHRSWTSRASTADLVRARPQAITDDDSRSVRGLRLSQLRRALGGDQRGDSSRRPATKG